jgi:hypothetical protein
MEPMRSHAQGPMSKNTKAAAKKANHKHQVPKPPLLLSSEAYQMRKGEDFLQGRLT